MKDEENRMGVESKQIELQREQYERERKEFGILEKRRTRIEQSPYF
jgi:hypothetical protein